MKKAQEEIPKRLVLVTGSDATRRELVAQLEELFENSVRIESHATDNGLPGKIEDALVLCTSNLVLDECKGRLDRSCKILVAKRTLNFAHLDKLYALPEGSSLLIVNDVKESADEVIELLRKTGFANYRYQACYPGSPSENLRYDFLITPGELAHTPPGAHDIIDIGPRILDITTIVEVVKSLKLFNQEIHERLHLISAKYLSKIISLGKELHRKHENLRTLNDFLVRMIDSDTDGIVSYDASGRIRLVNRIAGNLLQLVEDANLYEEARLHNRKLHAFLLEDALDNHLLELGDATYLVSKVVGEASDVRLLTIKNVRERINMENSLRKELKRQGYKAKYSFTALVHKSQGMKDLIHTAKKLSASDFNIMIFGESGTGKEILASSIHNASRRKNGPFLAVNFSALPDELIESELFGYEEGAFTGARKGGKTGLFEMAHQGTLFLDEIGDISPKIQSRLLRVLQEKEVLRVGGSKNIPVDVRVIAATNKNLAEMVKRNCFREDLYYRLKKLYIQIPPLRERREDILPLFSHFLIQKNGFDLRLTEEARRLLNEYDWPGNVRELENCVEYILAIRENDVIDCSDLSEDLLQSRSPLPESGDRLTEFVLLTIKRFNENRLLIGRRKLAELSREAQFCLSEQQVRKVLEALAARGLVQMGRGKIGLQLTSLASAYLGVN